MHQLDRLLSHVWMVRTFLKHCDEVEEDEELAEIPRELYDFALALGGPLERGDAAEYLRLAKKKFYRVQRAAEKFAALQPEISSHTNFRMAVQSLTAATEEMARVLAQLT